MSNHHHTVIYDRHGRYPEFLEYFHKLFARAQNNLRGRRENMWSSESASVIRLVGREDVLRMCVYTATNPINEHLVARIHHWPGVNGLSALLNDRPLQARRPRHFFRRTGTMPESVSLHQEIPIALGNADDVRTYLRAATRDKETSLECLRHRDGTRVLGRRLVLRQPWHLSPNTAEQRTEHPRVAAVNKWARLEARNRDRAFIDAYICARESWKLGRPALFPAGTYWLRRAFNVALHPLSAALQS
jgi:hypothetical protein